MRSEHIDEVESGLRRAKENVGLTREIKWTKIPSKDDLFEAYISVMDRFFEYIKMDMVKIRIMFTQNIHVPMNLTRQQKDNEYYLLYYQFIKNGLGLKHCGENPGDVIQLRFYFDDLAEGDPTEFKDFIYRLDVNAWGSSRFFIARENVAEVRSHDHCILQCMDIILGSMCFRLNDKHLEKPPGKHRRAKKTVYKDRMYNHIYRHIREIHPNFNPGCNTGLRGPLENAWRQPYRHWLFVPKEHRIDIDKSKKNHK